MSRIHANWLQSYCQFTSASESPLDFHFWTGVSTIAACLRRQVWIDQRIFKWYPNFYIIFVGPPGVVTKSTTLSIGYGLLRKIKGIHFGPDSMTWHGLAAKFSSAFEYKVYRNGTGQDIRLPMSPLTCSVSELGTFLRPDDKGLVSFLTDIWDGKDRPFEHTTKDSGEIAIEHPWLNVIGATTPMWMQNNFPSSLLAEGIGSRVIFVYGEAKRHLTAYPSDTISSAAYTAEEGKLVKDLEQISTLIGEYHLTSDALAWGRDWYVNSRIPTAAVASSRFSGYLARKQTHLHKLAMILAAAKRDDLIITKEDLIQADQILVQAENSMIRVFESVGVVDEAKHLAEVVAFVRAYGFITIHDLYYQKCHNIMSEKDFQVAVRHAVDGHLLDRVKQGGNLGLAPHARKTH